MIDKFVPQRETPEIKIALTKEQRVGILIIGSFVAILGSWLTYSVVADPNYWQLMHTLNTMCSFPPDSMRAAAYWYQITSFMGSIMGGFGIIFCISAVTGSIHIKLNMTLVLMVTVAAMIFLLIFPIAMGGC